MGCFDIFCFVCGNPSHSANYKFDTYLNDYNNYKKLLSKKKLNNKEINSVKYYTKIFKNHTPKKSEQMLQLVKDTKWMDKCSMLTLDDKIIHNVKEMSCNTQFVDKYNNLYEHLSLAYDNSSPCGVFIHTDCLKYINKKIGINIKCKHLPLTNITEDKILPINNGEIEKYWGQEFEFIDIIENNKTYLCTSPLKNGKNIGQINKNISQLKIKKEERPSPFVSATFYQNGLHKIGNNNKIWYTNGGRWIIINEPLILIHVIPNNSKQKKKLYNLSRLGLHSNYPAFIVEIKNTRVNIEYTILTVKSFEEKLK